MNETTANREAQKYFTKFVKPGFDEWRKTPSDERLAMNLANSLNNIAEYYWHDCESSNPAKVFNKRSLKEFRKELTFKNKDIALIRDIADAHKHLKLNRTDRLMTRANQVDGKTIGFGEAYGLCYGGGEVLAIVLDDESEKYFPLIAEGAYEYWKNELQ